MVRSLLSLYVRAGIGIANLTVRVVARSANLAADAVRMAVPSSAQPVHSEPEDVFGQAVEPPPEPPRESPRAVDSDGGAPPPLDEATERVKTIDDEPELVAELAEPGAEDGAGAELEVDEPWQGYDDLRADEVATRIGSSDAAELAVVELYERSHKQRRTVLNAAERRQRELANAPS